MSAFAQRPRLGKKETVRTAALLLLVSLSWSVLSPGPVVAQKTALRKRAPELEGGVGWLGVDQPLRLQDLRGKIVVLDFWTLC